MTQKNENGFSAAQAAEMLQQVRATAPLVHNITNFVVMNFTANALLAAGASPVMAHAAEEVEEMASLAKALVLNIGTLDAVWLDAMMLAGKKAGASGIPIVLDPVGAGATKMRTDASLRFLRELPIRVLRGNASEILSLAGGAGDTKGVDSAHGVEDAVAAADALARTFGTVVVVTGESDYATDGRRALRVHGGVARMGRVTGCGCALSSLIGAFTAIHADALEAAAAALVFYGLCGERAAETARGNGTFIAHFLDALGDVSPADVQAGFRVEESVVS